MLTFRSGGWVIALALLLSTALVLWAVGPALIGAASRPGGRAGDVASFSFDLSNLTVPIEHIAAALPHRDALRSLDTPTYMLGIDMARFNVEQRGKYVVPDDRIIGVVINGEARAYPLHVLNAHEIVNDILGDVPIAVTYHPLCDSVVVFERRVGDATLTFGVSGLVLDGNLLMYDRETESLWSQLRARAIAGPEVETAPTLTIVPAMLTTWWQWLSAHPQTTVIERDPESLRRYKQFNYGQYFQSDDLPYLTRPLPLIGDFAPKTPMLIIGEGDAAEIFAITQLCSNRVDGAQFQLQLSGGTTVTLLCTRDPMTCHVVAAFNSSGESIELPVVRYALWFAWLAATSESD